MLDTVLLAKVGGNVDGACRLNVHPPESYSCFSAVLGSTIDARRAGTYAASKATAESESTASTRVPGSRGRISKRKLRNTSPSARAPMAPNVTPIRVKV